MFGFKKQKKVIEILAPFDGETIDIATVNDPVFSQLMLGDGCAIIPSSGDVYAPVTGKIVVVAETAHSVCLKTSQGMELMIHYGIDTVKHGGNGFAMKVENDQEVQAGELLFHCDQEYFTTQGVDMTSPILIINGDSFEIKEKYLQKKVRAGDVILKVTPKS